MTFVDAHLHVFSDDPARYPYDGRWGMIPTEPTPVEELIACMDANGVDKAVMVQGAAYLYDNRYMADCRALFPDRLAAVALLDPRAPGAADRLEEFWERDPSGTRTRAGCMRRARIRSGRVPASWACP